MRSFSTSHNHRVLSILTFKLLNHNTFLIQLIEIQNILEVYKLLSNCFSIRLLNKNIYEFIIYYTY